MEETSDCQMSSSLKRKLDDQDPEYHDSSEHETKRLRKLEENAKSGLAQRIFSIVKKEFSQELENKEKEVLQINERIEETRKALYYLRYAIVTHFYEKNQLKVPLDPPEQTRIHPAVKKLIGKQSLNIISTPQPRSCTIKTSTNKNNSSLNIKQETIEIEQIQTNTIKDLNDNTQEKEIEKPLTKIPRYIPPKEKDPLVLEHNYRAPSQKSKKSIIIGNISQWLPVDNRKDHASHKWMIYVRGPKEHPDVSDFITKVRFFLHPSYKPNDLVEVSSPPFHLSRRGWGEFPLRVQIHFYNQRNKPIDVIHHLKLDQTYTGIQTLGGETIIEVWLFNKGISLESDPTSPQDSDIDSTLDLEMSNIEKEEENKKVEENNIENSIDMKEENNVTIYHDETKEISSSSEKSSQLKFSNILIKLEKEDIKEEVIEEEIVEHESSDIQMNINEEVELVDVESSDVVIDDVVFNWECDETPILTEFPLPSTPAPAPAPAPPPPLVKEIPAPVISPVIPQPKGPIFTSPHNRINTQITGQIKTSLHSKPVKVSLPNSSNFIIKNSTLLTTNPQIKNTKPVLLYLKNGSIYKMKENSDNINNLQRNKITLPINTNADNINNLTRNKITLPINTNSDTINNLTRNKITLPINTKFITTKNIPQVSLLNQSFLKPATNCILNPKLNIINSSTSSSSPSLNKSQIFNKVNGVNLKPGESLLKTNSSRVSILNSELPQKYTKQFLSRANIKKEIKIESSEIDEKKRKKMDPGTLRYEEYMKELKERVDSCTFSSIGQCVRWLIPAVPLVTPKASDPQYRTIHPYAATSYSQFHEWPIGKQTASEWYRALKIRELLLSIGHIENKIWSTRGIINWARCHGYTQLSKSTSDCEEIKVSLNSTYSEAVDILESVETLSERYNGNDSEEEIDIISVNLPKKSEKIKIEPKEEKNYEILEIDSNLENEFVFLDQTSRKIGNPLSGEEIHPGLLYPLAHRVISKTVECLIEDILRKSLKKSWQRNSFRQPSSITFEDTRAALVENSKFDYFTKEHIGIQLNEKT